VKPKVPKPAKLGKARAGVWRPWQPVEEIKVMREVTRETKLPRPLQNVLDLCQLADEDLEEELGGRRRGRRTRR